MPSAIQKRKKAGKKTKVPAEKKKRKKVVSPKTQQKRNRRASKPKVMTGLDAQDADAELRYLRNELNMDEWDDGFTPTPAQLKKLRKQLRRKKGRPMPYGAKNGMYDLIDFIAKINHQQAPKILVDGRKRVGSAWKFRLDIWELVTTWNEVQLEAFYKKVTGEQIPSIGGDWSSYIHDVKIVIEDIFHLNSDDDTIEYDIYMMYPRGIRKVKQGEPDMGFGTKNDGSSKAGEKAKGKKKVSKKVAKKAPAKKSGIGSKKKAASKKKVAKKKVTKKTAAKKTAKKKATKKTGGKMGQFAPLGSRDWSKVPMEKKIVRGKEPRAGVRHDAWEVLPAGKAGLKISTWIGKVAESMGVSEGKAKSICWALLNRSNVVLK